MKSFQKDSDSSNLQREVLPYTEIEDGIIECQGIILKRLNKRHKHKTTIVEYYKCQNSYSRNKYCGPCKFSGKIEYPISKKPKEIKVIKSHSLFCLNNEGNKIYLKEINRNLFIDKQISPLPFEHIIYDESISQAKISIQIHNNEIDAQYMISNEIEDESSSKD